MSNAFCRFLKIFRGRAHVRGPSPSMLFISVLLFFQTRLGRRPSRRCGMRRAPARGPRRWCCRRGCRPRLLTRLGAAPSPAAAALPRGQFGPRTAAPSSGAGRRRRRRQPSLPKIDRQTRVHSRKRRSRRPSAAPPGSQRLPRPASPSEIPPAAPP